MWTTCLPRGEAGEWDFRIVEQVYHGIAPPIIDIAFVRRGPRRRERWFRRTENKWPNVASQMRAAFANIALKTGSNSPGELTDDLEHLRGRGLLL